jgi:hypothetical protein
LAPVNHATIAFCLANVAFTAQHMRTFGLQSATALPYFSLPSPAHAYYQGPT